MRTVYSFGYKMNGEDQFAVTGPSAPKIFDCRNLDNPHSNPELRRLTGKDMLVQLTVVNSDGAEEIIQQAKDYLDAHPDGVVAFGCSYGKHRSVALAEWMRKYYKSIAVIHTGAARDR